MTHSTNPFDRSCYGYHCDRRQRCGHYREADTRLQFWMPAQGGADCPHFEPREKWGVGPDREEGND